MAVDSAKDTQLITLNKLLTPPELGSGSRSGSDSDDAEAHLQPYALEHDAAGPAPGQQSGAAQGKSKEHAPSAAGLASEPTTKLPRSKSKASGGRQQQSELGSAPSKTGTQQQKQPLQRHSAAMTQQGSAVPAHPAGASSAAGPRPQQQQDRPGPSAPDEQDIRAAEAVLRSTMLPTQVMPACSGHQSQAKRPYLCDSAEEAGRYQSLDISHRSLDCRRLSSMRCGRKKSTCMAQTYFQGRSSSGGLQACWRSRMGRPASCQRKNRQSERLFWSLLSHSRCPYEIALPSQ